MKHFITSHLVKSADLNHHGTLFAGRSAEWLVESGFICAATSLGRPEDIVCINIHGFVFKKPIPKGDVLMMTSYIAKVGSTSMTVYVKAESEITGISPTDGFITFVCVDSKSGMKTKHGITLDETTDADELEVRRRAQEL
ncbi:acyl-CoA thioesterase [Guggenheimella bovis]